MEKKYLFFCAHGYAIPILRPLEKEIKRRGDEVAWFLEKSCPDSQLTQEDKVLKTLREVKAWNPLAVFAPGDWVYDFFPGVKVRVCHGYPIYKRGGTVETHFKIRGWFDIYCSTGPSSTPIFQDLEKKLGSFCVYETGWAKVDAIVAARQQAKAKENPDFHTSHTPTVFVATTFSKRVTQLRNLLPTIQRLVDEHNWKWIITMHPKLEDDELKEEIKRLAETHTNVEFYPVTPSPDVMAQTDVMLCDASSIIIEYMLLDKPVVTLCNTTPGPHLLNVETPDEVETALGKAMTRPKELMDAMHEYLDFHEAHRDGKNCARILDAVDDFIATKQHSLRRKPLNLFRKLKIRWHFLKH